ncbi:MAG TPA: hypothetical protein VIL71_19495 [Spirillospora sp.]
MSTLFSGCENHGPVEKPTYVTAWTRVRRWLERSENVFRAVHQPSTIRFEVPAQGDGYDFSVVVHFTWCVTGHAYPEALVARADEQQFPLKERLIARVRAVSREFAPYETAKAESRFDHVIGELFSATRLEFVSGGHPDGEARPIEHRTIVTMERPVRDNQREASIRRQNAVNEDDLSRLLVQQFSDRRLLWQRFLESGRSEWLTPYAVALAQRPDQVAGVVEKMVRDRRAEARELADHIVGQVQRYKEHDAFDLMLENDLVLRHLLKSMGVPDLPPPAPSPFDDE